MDSKSKTGSCSASPSKKGGESTKRTASGTSDGSAAAMGLIGSSLYQIPIPEGLESRTYGALYRLLARRGQIPLGILRGIYSHTKSGPKSNKMPYVFTNPPKDTELFTCDKVFVLSQTVIYARHHRGVDDMKEMQMYSNIRSRRKTAEDIIAAVGTLREELNSFEHAHSYLDEKVNLMADEINHKFDALFSALNVQYDASAFRPRANSMNSGDGSSGGGGHSRPGSAHGVRGAGGGGGGGSRPGSARRARPGLSRTGTAATSATGGLGPIVSGGGGARPMSAGKARGVSFD